MMNGDGLGWVLDVEGRPMAVDDVKEGMRDRLKGMGNTISDLVVNWASVFRNVVAQTQRRRAHQKRTHGEEEHDDFGWMDG